MSGLAPEDSSKAMTSAHPPKAAFFSAVSP
jgi:hypothetical protein